MPRPKNTSDALLADLTNRLERLVATARKEGHDQALAEVRSLVQGGSAGTGNEKKRKAAKKARRPAKNAKKPRKNPWANLTPAERLKRVNAIRKGRGLPLKRKL